MGILSIGTSFLSARLVLTLSSLNNVRWILLRLQRRTTFWLIYIRLYMVLFSSCVFSLGGLPPFLGFFNKFIIIKLILNQVRLFLVILIILLYETGILIFKGLSYWGY